MAVVTRGRAPRRTLTDVVADLLAVRNLVLLAVGAASAFGLTAVTTGPQLARLASAVDSVRSGLAEERRKSDVVMRVLCTDVVRDADDRARYGLLCAEIKRTSAVVLPRWPPAPTPTRPAAWQSGPPAIPVEYRRGPTRRARPP